MHNSLRRITGQPIEVLDFDDDGLTRLLRHLSQQNIWDAIEQELRRRCIQVYEWPTEVVRCDTTTVSGYHTVEEGGVMQFGHSKGDLTLPQLKRSTTTLDLGGLGMPVAIAVVSGETADDGLYVGMVTRTVDTCKEPGCCS